MYIGIDEFGQPVYVSMIFRNLLAGSEPGGGKSTLLNLIVAHAALSPDCRLVLLDGKQVELGQWEACADVFVGPDIDHALATLRRLQTVMNNRYAYLHSQGRRKITRRDAFSPILVTIDELAYFSATVGDRKTQEAFSSPAAGPGGPGPGGGHHRRGGDAAALVGHHPHLAAGSVRVAVGRPVHHRRVVATSCSATAGRPGAGRPTRSAPPTPALGC